VILAHRHEGVFYMKVKGDDVLLTKNMVPGQSVYNEKRVNSQVYFLLFFVYSSKVFCYYLFSCFYVLLGFVC